MGGVRDRYRIPRGGLFEWVSCPHYLGEIIIYVGFALLLRGRGRVLLVVAWVVRLSRLL
jgi:steroid 5-alpha reductase family enzyme